MAHGGNGPSTDDYLFGRREARRVRFTRDESKHSFCPTTVLEVRVSFLFSHSFDSSMTKVQRPHSTIFLTLYLAEQSKYKSHLLRHSIN
ncbi:hypothetical protein VNO78_15011 [Psophocarpus tetragonolobus]|uniref:Uncharacterized protein n=1 Tax=Psophocarpus tetragonolobus TaxID=3891 RepID=A0AAN9XIT3_PSOTE